MKHAFHLSVVVLASSLVAETTLAQQVLISPPARNARDPELPELAAYIAAMQPTFAELDKVMAKPPKDPLQAAEKVNAACAAINESLALVRAVAAPEGKKGQPIVASYAKGHASAWAFVCDRGARTARLLSMMNDTIDIWENNWIPKLRSKKTEFRNTGDELNSAYNRIKTAAAVRHDDKDFEADLERFKTSVSAADTLGRTLTDLSGLLKEGIEQGDPDKNFKPIAADLFATLSVPPKPLPENEGIWLLHLHQWRDLMLKTNKRTYEAYEKAKTASLSLRKQTSFFRAGPPMQGLEFKQIHPTFQALYDKLVSGRSAIRAKAEAENRQWEKDRQRILELYRETDATSERALKLEAARAESAERIRQLELADARGDQAEVRRLKAQIEKDKRDVAQKQADFDALRKRNDKEIDRIERENAKRREDLSLPERPFSRPE